MRKGKAWSSIYTVYPREFRTTASPVIFAFHRIPFEKEHANMHWSPLLRTRWPRLLCVSHRSGRDRTISKDGIVIQMGT